MGTSVSSSRGPVIGKRCGNKRCQFVFYGRGKKSCLVLVFLTVLLKIQTEGACPRFTNALRSVEETPRMGHGAPI